MPQPDAADIARLAERGYRSIIGNRPDAEEPGQPSWREIQAAAIRSGMEARHIPVIVSEISDDEVRAFARALRILPKPIAAFCRTGTRSTLLWALANDEMLSVSERISIAAGAGYDLEAFRQLLERHSRDA
jgi:sulfide:quinone oxidoreductase